MFNNSSRASVSKMSEMALAVGMSSLKLALGHASDVKSNLSVLA